MTQTEKKESTTQTATGSYQAKHGRYGLSTHTDIRAGNTIIKRMGTMKMSSSYFLPLKSFFSCYSFLEK